jgi:S-formylglutathione hydrolase FrmB
MKNVQKAPGEIEDFTLNWVTRGLGGDTITGSTWDVMPAGLAVLTNPAPSYTTTTTTLWVSGGASGVVYTVTNTITTAGGRTLKDQFQCLVYP